MIRGHDAGIMTCHAAVYFTLTGVGCTDQMICVVVGVHLHLPVHLTPAGPGHGRHVAGQQLLVVPHDLRVARLVLRLGVVKVFENSVAFIIIS